jgi:hypothetical protein
MWQLCGWGIKYQDVNKGSTRGNPFSHYAFSMLQLNIMK